MRFATVLNMIRTSQSIGHMKSDCMTTTDVQDTGWNGLAMSRSGKRARNIERGAMVRDMMRAGVRIAGIVCLVAAAANAALSDSAIADALESVLRQDPSVSAHAITVDVEEGIVTLSGWVGNLLEKERAIVVAKTIKGVRGIVDAVEPNPVARENQDLREDIRRALALDPVAESFEIDVAVDDGVVTLSGSVDSYAERRIAVNAAKGVKGIREIIDEISIDVKDTRSNSEIQAEIKARLRLDPYVDHRTLHVAVENGRVVLSGTVRSMVEANYAMEDARVAGVKSIDINQLEVDWKAGRDMRRDKKHPVRTDEQILRALKDVFEHDARVESFNLAVTVRGGTVSLRGTVDNLMARRAAERGARNVMGVAEVQSFLKVRPVGVESDAAIERDVRRALKWDPVVERHDITLWVRNRKVYLYGKVDSEYEKQHAADVAAGVSGVAEVTNNVVVRTVPWSWKSDVRIQRDIMEHLRWDSRVDAESIAVEVHDGVATLKGEVDGFTEYAAALSDALGGGAKRVRSELSIEGTRRTYPRVPIHFGKERLLRP
ncbi:MAG: BON domain-containing protein [Chitinivibrionales bacterium]|nr:BON domain-containing protein [Chitinivibrionales bacterium]MBD3396510.1 BON domain-containing protein [Chitinivibrionales bacterium]